MVAKHLPNQVHMIVHDGEAKYPNPFFYDQKPKAIDDDIFAVVILQKW
jgi:hypothetical protein